MNNPALLLLLAWLVLRPKPTAPKKVKPRAFP